MRPADTRFILGVLTGVVNVGGAGILLTEFSRYPDAPGPQVIRGFAAGAWIGLILTRYHRA